MAQAKQAAKVAQSTTATTQAAPTAPVKGKGFVKVLSPVARLSYSHIYAPDPGSPQVKSDGKYKVTLLFDKSTDLSEMKAKCLEAARQVWPNIDPKMLKLPFRDGDKKKNKDGETPDGYVNAIFTTAKSKKRPGVCGPKKDIPLPEGFKVYAGCYGRASLTAVTYEKEVEIFDPETGDSTKKHIPAVTFWLNAIQFIRDGVPFGGSGGVDDFDDVSDEELGVTDDDGAPSYVGDDDIPF